MRLALLNALLVGSGGFAGAILRYALGGLVHRSFPMATFPFGTLAVNLLGCLFIGAFAGLADSRHAERGVGCVECHTSHTAGGPAELYYMDREAVLPVCRNCHEEF